MLNLSCRKDVKKHFIFAFMAVSIFVSLVVASSMKAGQNPRLIHNPDPTPTPSAKIENVSLDRSEVFNPCPPGRSPKAGTVCDDTSLIKVETSVVNPNNTELLYYYTISGGRIVGKGANVSWDLSGVRPGTYTITVGIGDESGIYPEAQTKIIKVKECDCGFADACPVIEISSPADSVKAGETITFAANVAGDSVSGMRFDWTISAGTIIEGQGTAKIKVETAPEMADGNLTVTVQINSERVAGICETSASKSVSITK